MKNIYLPASLFSCTLLAFFASQVLAGATFVNSVIEEGRCGHEGIGKIQYLQNSDQSNGYEVTVSTIEMHKGEKKEITKSHSIKAGGKKHLGCNFSDIMPLTSYERSVVSETKNP